MNSKPRLVGIGIIILKRIDEKFVLKVSDFGLSEDNYARNYFRHTGLQDSEGETPVKLQAINSVHFWKCVLTPM